MSVAIDLGNVRGFGGPQGEPGAAGAKGADGSTILHGTGAPDNNLGNNGDYYLDAQGGHLYQKTAGAWGEALATFCMGSLETETIDFLDNEHWEIWSNALRKERDNDTRDFFTPSTISGRSDVVRAVKKAGTVMLTVTRKRFYNQETAATAGNYYYHFKDFGADGGPDHHNFGPILPEGWRPAADIYFPYDAIGSSGARYHGLFRLMPDGSFGERALYNSSGTAAGDVKLDALFFSVTFLAEI
jgi:hypothetical protein